MTLEIWVLSHSMSITNHDCFLQINLHMIRTGTSNLALQRKNINGTFQWNE